MKIQKSEVVAHTPNGREVRRETMEDGTVRFACQPPRDNYWAVGATADEAMGNAGWPPDASADEEEVLAALDTAAEIADYFG